MPPDKVAVESDSFGLVKPLHIKEAIVSSITKRYPAVTKAINEWMSKMTVSEDFSWSAFTVSRSWCNARHRDTKTRVAHQS